MNNTTIIVPVFNTDIEKLNKCIDSIIDIKGLFECLIIDDGSGPEIEDYFRRKIHDYSIIKYIKKTNGGVSSARNLGLEYAKGEYVIFVDSDDIVDSRMVEKQLEIVSADLMISNLEYVSPHSSKIWNALSDAKNSTRENLVFEVSTHGRLNGPVCKIIKKEFLTKNEIRFDESMILGEDAVFFYKVLANNPTIEYFNEVTYYYIADSQTSESRIMNSPELMLDNYKKMHSELCKLIDLSVCANNRKACIAKAIEKHVKLLFDFALEMSCKSRFLPDRENSIRELLNAMIKDGNVVNYVNGYEVSKRCRIEYQLLSERKWKIIKCIAKIRDIYLKIKYGR